MGVSVPSLLIESTDSMILCIHVRIQDTDIIYVHRSGVCMDVCTYTTCACYAGGNTLLYVLMRVLSPTSV